MTTAKITRTEAAARWPHLAAKAKRRGRGNAKPETGHYIVKAVSENVILYPEQMTYEQARLNAIRLGGIVTNMSFAKRHGFAPKKEISIQPIAKK